MTEAPSPLLYLLGSAIGHAWLSANPASMVTPTVQR